MHERSYYIKDICLHLLLFERYPFYISFSFPSVMFRIDLHCALCEERTKYGGVLGGRIMCSIFSSLTLYGAIGGYRSFSFCFSLAQASSNFCETRVLGACGGGYGS
jgi:hypothetical protein